MYLVKYEEYLNDLCRKHHEKTFPSLDDIAEWMFGMMKRDPARNMTIPVPNKSYTNGGICRIEMRPSYATGCVWIHQIDSHRGIEFSDGQLTSGQTHWSQEIQKWLIECKERQTKPVYNFVG